MKHHKASNQGFDGNTSRRRETLSSCGDNCVYNFFSRTRPGYQAGGYILRVFFAVTIIGKHRRQFVRATSCLRVFLSGYTLNGYAKRSPLPSCPSPNNHRSFFSVLAVIVVQRLRYTKDESFTRKQQENWSDRTLDPSSKYFKIGRKEYWNTQTSKSVFYSYSISNLHGILNSKIHPFHSINISYNTERKLKRTHIFPPSQTHLPNTHTQRYPFTTTTLPLNRVPENR